LIATIIVLGALGLCGLIAQEPKLHIDARPAPVGRLVFSNDGRILVEGRELRWFSDGKPLNGQCPVCGTMADPAKLAPGEMRWTCEGQTGKSSICSPYLTMPVQNLTRCKRCNCAFWQDAEPDKAVQP
jgi:hypothetical protein